MQRSEVRAGGKDLGLDLAPPVRLDAWAISVAFGIVLVTVLPPIAPVVVISSVVVSAAALVWKDFVPPEWKVMALLAPLFVGGGAMIALLHAAAPDPLRELAAMEPGEVVIVGEVASPPELTGFGYLADMTVEGVWYEGEEVIRGGGVEVFAPGLDGVGVGDRVRVNGDISLPEVGEDGFDYGKYLATKRISAVVEATGAWPVDEERGWIGRVHRRTDIALGYGLHPEEAAVVRGMVLGDRSLIPEELDEAFQKSGITHVLAISGQHVAVLTAVIYFVLRAFAVPLVARVPMTLALIWAYIVVAGAPPSALRAGVVATLVLGAGLIDRQVSPLHFMSTMLAVVLAYNPLLVYNTGFQLSVAAVFGILLLRKPLKRLIEKTVFRPFGKPPDLISNLLAISLAAQVATTPIIAAAFGQVSVIGVATNLVAVPISGPILTLGLLAAMVGNVVPLLAFPLNAVNGSLVTVLEVVAETAASLPFATVTTSGVSLLMISFFYLGCIPAALCRFTFPEERWPLWAGVMVCWVVLWLVLASLSSV